MFSIKGNIELSPILAFELNRNNFRFLHKIQNYVFGIDLPVTKFASSFHIGSRILGDTSSSTLDLGALEVFSICMDCSVSTLYKLSYRKIFQDSVGGHTFQDTGLGFI